MQTNNEILKWKPLQQVAIDFFIAANEKPGAKLVEDLGISEE
jgi:hypothetical protein